MKIINISIFNFFKLSFFIMLKSCEHSYFFHYVKTFPFKNDFYSFVFLFDLFNIPEHFLLNEFYPQQDLYHEHYNCIAVMFASIPNYKEFYDENDVNKQGLECLRLLNEIICDFDKVCIHTFVLKNDTISLTHKIHHYCKIIKKKTCPHIWQFYLLTIIKMMLLCKLNIISVVSLSFPQ